MKITPPFSEIDFDTIIANNDRQKLKDKLLEVFAYYDHIENISRSQLELITDVLRAVYSKVGETDEDLFKTPPRALESEKPF